MQLIGPGKLLHSTKIPLSIGLPMRLDFFFQKRAIICYFLRTGNFHFNPMSILEKTAKNAGNPKK